MVGIVFFSRWSLKKHAVGIYIVHSSSTLMNIIFISLCPVWLRRNYEEHLNKWLLGFDKLNVRKLCAPECAPTLASALGTFRGFVVYIPQGSAGHQVCTMVEGNCND